MKLMSCQQKCPQPGLLPVRFHYNFFLQISRLQNGAEVSREVYSLAKDELRHSHDYYMLFWPERKVGASLSPGNKWEKTNDPQLH